MTSSEVPSSTRSIDLPPPVAADPQVLLVGVAHVLDLESDLDRVLSSYRPQALAVELDPERAQILAQRVRERQAGGTDARRGGGEEVPIMLRLWARLQDRFAGDLGGVPGEEMLVVGSFAKKRSLPCFLVDDPLREVAPRLLASLSPKERIRLLISTVIALFVPTKLIEREIQSYSEHREQYMEVLREQYPSLSRVLLDERNQHMSERIQALARSYGRVAAVVGDAHVDGLSQAIHAAGLPVDRVHLEALTGKGASPPPKVVPPGPAKASP